MTLDEILERKRARAIFLLGMGAIVLLLILLRYFVLPKFDTTLTQGGWQLVAKTFEDVSTTLIVTVVVALFLWLITPSRVRHAGVEVVDPRELKGEFAQALKNSDQWRFFGGCGRYFRTAVLEEMKRRAQAESTTKELSAVILNPGNLKLCEQHGRYRSGTGRGRKEGIWSAKRVKQELVTTIILILRAKETEGLLDIKLYLADQFSSFRADIAQSCAIETREDPQAPALKSYTGTYFFQALNDEFRILRDQSTEIRQGKECVNAVDAASIRTAIGALGIVNLTLDDDDCQQILALLKDTKNPYA